MNSIFQKGMWGVDQKLKINLVWPKRICAGCYFNESFERALINNHWEFPIGTSVKVQKTRWRLIQEGILLVSQTSPLFSLFTLGVADLACETINCNN